MPYVPLHEILPDLAKHETQNIIISEGESIPADEYALLEAYCDEENCDCRRVFFHVMSKKTKNKIACITHGWENTAFYIKWMGSNDLIDTLHGTSLEMQSPPCKFADDLVDLIDEVLKTDLDYLERIKNHYRLFREKIGEQHKRKPFVLPAKTNRNDLCPCGSGKKFKKCCFQ